MSTKQSPIIANPASDPRVLNDPQLDGGRIRHVRGTMELEDSDLASGDTIELLDIPADAVIKSIKLSNDELDSGTDLIFDLGLYAINSDGTLGAAKDADVYSDDDAGFQSAQTQAEYAFDERDINTAERRVFADAGDTEDEHDAQYRLVATSGETAGGAQAGTLTFEVEYLLPA